MPERDSWAVMDGTTRVVDAEDARIAIAALATPGTSAILARQGLRPGPGDPGKVTASATPDVNVHTEAHQLFLTASRGQGTYIATLDADKTIDVLTDNPADPSNDRHDLIVAQQSDTYYGDASTAYEVRHVVGTPATSPSDPDPTAGGESPDYATLARVRVAAGATSITDADIDDLRPGWSASLGGIVPVANATERDALTPFDGLTVFRLDLGAMEHYDSDTGWTGPARMPQVQKFDAAGSYTWTKPAGASYVVVDVAGAGGGGAGCVATGTGEGSGGGGGGGGGGARKTISASNLGSTESVTVGAGGASQSGGSGFAGGDSSFGSHCSATGGGGGTATVGPVPRFAIGPGGPGGTGSGGDLNFGGGAGDFYAGDQYRASPGRGGNSVYGGGGGKTSFADEGSAGTSYGGGGSGAANAQDSPAKTGYVGADGVVIVTSYF